MDCAEGKNRTEKRSGVLTYDTTLQGVAGAAQQDLFLSLSLLGGHFIGFLLLAGVGATGRKRWDEVGGDAKAEAGAGLILLALLKWAWPGGQGRSSCKLETKEKSGGIGERRDDGAHWKTASKVNGMKESI